MDRPKLTLHVTIASPVRGKPSRFPIAAPSAADIESPSPIGMVHEYLMCRRHPMSDLMAWNFDATRMPFRMHRGYLHKLFWRNDLFGGRYQVEGRSIVLSDVNIPMFALATETEHVAPWHSAYKINLLGNADITFVLPSGGHNAGITSEPGHCNHRYHLARRMPPARNINPDIRFAATPVTEGSWWTAWTQWLAGASSGRLESPSMGAPDKRYPAISPAPGGYVFGR